MPITDNDARVTTYLQRLADKDQGLETPAEIARSLGLTAAQVRAALKRLETAGQVRTVGESFSGAKTWALTSDARFSER